MLKKDKSENILRKANDMQVKGRKPPNRPRKNWKQCVMEDLNLVNINDEEAANKEK